MVKAQNCRVERQSRHFGINHPGSGQGIRKLRIAWSAGRCSIFRITVERMAGFGKMNADLMRSARFESAFNEREAVELLPRTQMCDGPFSDAFARRAPPFAVAAVFDQKRLNRPRVDVSSGDGEIHAFDRVLFKLPDQDLL